MNGRFGSWKLKYCANVWMNFLNAGGQFRSRCLKRSAVWKNETRANTGPCRAPERRTACESLSRAGAITTVISIVPEIKVLISEKAGHGRQMVSDA